MLAKLVVKVKHMKAMVFNFDLHCRQELETMFNRMCVWIDNTSAIAVAMGHDLTHETVKHVTVKDLFIHDCEQSKVIMIAYINMSENSIADISFCCDSRFSCDLVQAPHPS